MCDFEKQKPQGEALPGFALRPIVLMSLQPAIPWRVALLHCPPPLHRLVTILHRPADSVNHHLTRAGEFSTGTMGNFRPELTLGSKQGPNRRRTSLVFSLNDACKLSIYVGSGPG